MADELDKFFKDMESGVFGKKMEKEISEDIVDFAKKKGMLTEIQAEQFMIKCNTDDAVDPETMLHIDNVITSSLRQYKQNNLYKQIDRALENNNKEMFIRLTNELKNMNLD